MAKPKNEQRSSDPLPYTQVDRSVKQWAGMLSTRLKVSFQHALGGLVQFWETNGDPRELEALLREGKEEVVISGEEVMRRFSVAMSVPPDAISPDDLVALRLLESREDGYRVRGMSRYFTPLARRIQVHDAAVAGGKASAIARRAKFGTAQPFVGADGAQFGDASKGAQSTNEPRLEAVRDPVRSTPEAPLEAPPNTASSVQRTPVEDLSSAAAIEITGADVAATSTAMPPPSARQLDIVKADDVHGGRSDRDPRTTVTGPGVVARPTLPVEAWTGEDFWAWAQDRRQAGGLIAERERPSPRKLGAWYSAAMLTLKGDVERLKEAFYAYASDKHWKSAKPPVPFKGFISQWDRYVPPAPRGPYE